MRPSKESQMPGKVPWGFVLGRVSERPRSDSSARGACRPRGSCHPYGAGRESHCPRRQVGVGARPSSTRSRWVVARVRLVEGLEPVEALRLQPVQSGFKPLHRAESGERVGQEDHDLLPDGSAGSLRRCRAGAGAVRSSDGRRPLLDGRASVRGPSRPTTRRAEDRRG